VETVSNRPGPAGTGLRRRHEAPSARAPAALGGWLEALGVALSPALAALVLRLRLMAPSDLPDPAMHTIYIIDPRQVFARYTAIYEPTARLRESTRVGFLVPARLAYLAFGPAGGFFVMRYVLALIAVAPVYLMLRRLYGPPAGVAGVLVLLSSPVLVTAWGTDYPDSAVVSYAAGALACLAMPCSARWRRGWLAGAGVLLTLAVWSHGVAVPLVGATMVAYLAVRMIRDRAGLLGDVVLLAGVAAAVTALLIAASAVLIGHANFIATTWQAYRYLSQPSQVVQWHSSNWRWAPYVAYLLVPPAVLAGFAAATARRGRAVATPVLQVGVMFAAQLVVYVGLQFFGTVQTLEEHYFSSTLWAAVCLAFAITVAELARPLSDRPVARWLPAAVLLAVPLCYEADPHVPAFGWAPLGAILAAAVIAAAVAARWCARITRPLVAAVGLGAALVAFAGASLVLTAAPIPAHRTLPGTVFDPPPAYASALGGGWATYLDSYRIAAALPLFAGPAAYPGEQILTWWPISDGSPSPFTEYAGMYHGKFNTLPSNPPDLTPAGRAMLRARRPAEVLLYDTSTASFPTALRNLSHFEPTLVRTAVLRSGSLVLHVWLIRLGRYYHRPAVG
jgi:Dolichyl-phosphate-mannose-protein mannosyltransferase